LLKDSTDKGFENSIKLNQTKSKGYNLTVNQRVIRSSRIGGAR